MEQPLKSEKLVNYFRSYRKHIQVDRETDRATFRQTEQESQRCPKRRVAQAALRLQTAVITFRNKERNVRSPS